MSEENIEIVRSAYAAVNEGDWDAVAEVTARDAVLDFSRSISPQQGIYRGRDAFARYIGTIGDGVREIPALAGVASGRFSPTGPGGAGVGQS